MLILFKINAILIQIGYVLINLVASEQNITFKLFVDNAKYLKSQVNKQ